MKHQLYKYSTNQLMVSSFADELCAVQCPQLSGSPNFFSSGFHLSLFTVRRLTLRQKSLSDFSDLNTMLLCRVGLVTHPSLLQELVSKFRVKSAALCFKAPSQSSSSSILQKVWALSQGGAIRYLFSCPQRSEAWLNKEPIHALVDLLCSLIHSLRWTLIFAWTTNVLVEQSGRESSLSTVEWYGWKIASCRWGIMCECTHAHTLSSLCSHRCGLEFPHFYVIDVNMI